MSFPVYTSTKQTCPNCFSDLWITRVADEEKYFLGPKKPPRITKPSWRTLDEMPSGSSDDIVPFDQTLEPPSIQIKPITNATLQRRIGVQRTDRFVSFQPLIPDGAQRRQNHHCQQKVSLQNEVRNQASAADLYGDDSVESKPCHLEWLHIALDRTLEAIRKAFSRKAIDDQIEEISGSYISFQDIF